MVGGTTVNHLNVKDVKELWITIPVKEEQEEVVKDISKCIQALKKLRVELSSLCNIKEGLLSDLITGKVRI